MGVAGGLVLHSFASYRAGIDIQTITNVSLILDSPLLWLQALGDPLMWSLGVGIAFSIYGWTLYFLGLWGGADAFAMSVLGFAAPYGFAGPEIAHSINLFINIMIVGFFYTLGFAFYKAFKKKSVWYKTWQDIKEQELRITVEILLATLLSLIGTLSGSFNGLMYFLVLVSFIFLYRFLKNIEEGLLTQEVPVSELEGGEVLARTEEKGGMIKGITQEEIDSLEVDKVSIKEGVRFIPVFPVALVITLAFGGGIEWLTVFFN